MTPAPTRLALCAVAKNEGRYIEEWLAFHVLQGVGAFVVFDNGSTDDTRAILERASRDIALEVVDWPSSDHYQMQQRAYEEGARRLAGRAEWAAFIDLDEFVFSSGFKPLPEELAEFGPEVGAIAVGHRIFGSSGHTDYAPELVTTRFTRAARLDHEQSRWFKTIVRPELVEEFDSAHSVRLKSGAYVMADRGPLTRDNPDWHPGHADRVGPGAISLHHYMVKSLEEFRWKQRRFEGKKLEHRYSDVYFHEHSAIGDEVENRDLVRFADQIRATIEAWRGSDPGERIGISAPLAPAPSPAPLAFPLFGGLVARRDPDDLALFREVERRSGRAGFADKRVAAEAMFLTGPHTRAEAYACLVAAHDIEPAEAERLRTLEELVEAESLFALAEGVRAIGPEDPVIADLAHDDAQVRRILRDICQISPDRPIRRRIGARPALLAVAEPERAPSATPEFRPATSPARTAIETELADAGFGPLANLAREARLSTWSDVPENRRAQLLQIELNFPLLFLLCLRLLGRARETGWEHVLFSARDGYLWSRLWDEMRRRLPGAPTGAYFFTSRVARAHPTPDYLDYFEQARAGRRTVVADLCGTGWSLSRLIEAAPPPAADVFLLHQIEAPEIVAQYGELGPLSAPIRVEAVARRPASDGDNDMVEELNRAPHPAVLGVRRSEAGFEPVFSEIAHGAEAAALIRAHHAAFNAACRLVDTISPAAIRAMSERETTGAILGLYGRMNESLADSLEPLLAHKLAEEPEVWERLRAGG